MRNRAKNVSSVHVGAAPRERTVEKGDGKTVWSVAYSCENSVIELEASLQGRSLRAKSSWRERSFDEKSRAAAAAQAADSIEDDDGARTECHLTVGAKMRGLPLLIGGAVHIRVRAGSPLAGSLQSSPTIGARENIDTVGTAFPISKRHLPPIPRSSSAALSCLDGETCISVACLPRDATGSSTTQQRTIPCTHTSNPFLAARRACRTAARGLPAV